jgi:hemerythrin-like domain-containing protein
MPQGAGPSRTAYDAQTGGGLERDHKAAEKSHAEVDQLGHAWLVDGTLLQSQVARFSELVRELTELYRAHIAVEEHEVLPAAATVLGSKQCETVGSEMAARRGLLASQP